MPTVTGRASGLSRVEGVLSPFNWLPIRSPRALGSRRPLPKRKIRGSPILERLRERERERESEREREREREIL